MRRRGVQLILGTEVKRLEGRDGVFEGIEIGRQTYPAELALIDVGVLPNTELAEISGIPLGRSGAIQVDERGQTGVNGIYAAGNCAQTVHRVTGSALFSTLGTSAVLRVENCIEQQLPIQRIYCIHHCGRGEFGCSTTTFAAHALPQPCIFQ